MYARSLQSSSAAVILGNRWLLAALVQGGFKPVEFLDQIALDITDMHLDRPVAARLQPGLPRGAVFCAGLGLISIDQPDPNPLHDPPKTLDFAAARPPPPQLRRATPYHPHHPP